MERMKGIRQKQTPRLQRMGSVGTGKASPETTYLKSNHGRNDPDEAALTLLFLRRYLEWSAVRHRFRLSTTWQS